METNISYVYKCINPSPSINRDNNNNNGVNTANPLDCSVTSAVGLKVPES